MPRTSRSFRDHVVVLTGASSGIGREMALRLAPERPRLVLAARDRERLAEVAERCRQLGAESTVVPTDVGDQEACARLVTETFEQHGRIDDLFLNAGQDMWTRLDELTDPAILEEVLRVNTLGPAWITWSALAEIRARRGRIVVVSSLAGLAGIPTRTAYSASKHALHGFFDALRAELAGTGVSVTLVCPDFVATEIHRRAFGPDGRPFGDRAPGRPEKFMTAERCAAAIVAAARRRKRLVLLSTRGRLGRYVRLVAPGLIDRVAIRAVDRGH